MAGKPDIALGKFLMTSIHQLPSLLLEWPLEAVFPYIPLGKFLMTSSHQLPSLLLEGPREAVGFHVLWLFPPSGFHQVGLSLEQACIFCFLCT